MGNLCIFWFAPVLSVLIIAINQYSIVAAPANNYLQGTHYSLTNERDLRKQPFLEVRNATYHGSGPREEARAMCSVRTQEVNATANATITRRLHGVVTSKELHTSIKRLEVIIHGQMQQLWQSLDALRAQLTSHATPVSYPDRRTLVFRYQPNSG